MLLPLAFLPLLVPAQEPDLGDVVDALEAYLEARTALEEVEAARDALEDALAAAWPGGDALRHPRELGRALQLARAEDVRKLKPGKVMQDEHTGGAFAVHPLRYVYRLPREYDPEAAAYPLVLVIPDEDETAAAHLRDRWSAKALREGAIVVAIGMPAERDAWELVMSGASPGGLMHVLTTARLATERFAVDANRVHLVGRGKGAATAMTAGDQFPHRFAGVVALAGDAPELTAANFANLPTLLLGGGARAREFATAVEDAGHGNCTLEPEGDEERAWRWMQEHPRAALPPRVSLAVGTPFPVRSSWVRLAPVEVDARATVRADRASNTLRIDAYGTSRVTLHLSDELLDLSRPVKVSANGKEGEVRVPRSLALTLDRMLDGTSDTSAVYTAELTVDLGGEDPLWPEATEVPEDQAVADRLRAAADVAGYMAVHAWCVESGRAAGVRSALRQVLVLEPDHREAREALGHHWSRFQWFEDEAVFRRFLADQDPEAAAARGWVEYQGLWMHPDERAQLSKGREKDQESGEWLTTAERKRLAAGWVRQDLTWIPPNEAHRVDQGLWKVDGAWVDLASADRRRSRLGSQWTIPGARVRLHTTCDRAVALGAREHMELALEDMRKVLGADPPLPLDVALYRIEEQFDRFAFGEPDGRRPPAHVGREHTIHNGFFAESWFPGGAFAGMGVGLWDSDYPHGDAYGVHSARFALGLSYVDALDPSPKATRRGPSATHLDTFEEEKSLPRWLRWGAAVYAERYYEDSTVPPGGDPWWTRRWSLENLGTPGPLAETLAFEVDPDERERAQALLLEAGLVVSFMVDGDCEPVRMAHATLKQDLVERRLRRKTLTTLVEVLLANEDALRAFAELE